MDRIEDIALAFEYAEVKFNVVDLGIFSKARKLYYWTGERPSSIKLNKLSQYIIIGQRQDPHEAFLGDKRFHKWLNRQLDDLGFTRGIPN